VTYTDCWIVQLGLAHFWYPLGRCDHGKLEAPKLMAVVPLQYVCIFYFSYFLSLLSLPSSLASVLSVFGFYLTLEVADRSGRAV
jgi:hypothetical protein